MTDAQLDAAVGSMFLAVITVIVIVAAGFAIYESIRRAPRRR